MDLEAVDAELAAYGKSEEELSAVVKRAIASIPPDWASRYQQLVSLSQGRPISALPPPRSAPPVEINMDFAEGAFDSAPAPAGSVPPPPRMPEIEPDISSMLDDFPDDDAFDETDRVSVDNATTAEARVDVSVTAEHRLPEANAEEDFELLVDEEFEVLDEDMLGDDDDEKK